MIRIAVAVSMTSDVAVVVLTYNGVSMDTGIGSAVPTDGAALVTTSVGKVMLGYTGRGITTLITLPGVPVTAGGSNVTCAGAAAEVTFAGAVMLAGSGKVTEIGNGRAMGVGMVMFG
jgi:hypothetical protein